VFANKDKHSLLNIWKLFFKWHSCSGAPLIGKADILSKKKENLMKRIIFYFLFIICFLQLACSTKEEFKVISQIEGPVKTNCYLLYGLTTKEAAIIDVADPLDSITTFIKENDLNLKYIFITHAHWDHLEGLFEIKNKFPSAKVCLTKEEYSVMQDYTRYAKESDPQRFENVMKDSAFAKMMSIDLSLIEPDIFVRDNDEYELGNSVIRTVFSPGHSAGSVCYYCNNFLFSGDVLFYRTVGNTDFYKASRKDQIESVRKLYKLFPDSTIVYPGHGQFTDIGSEKKENKYITIDGGKWDIK
jgi:hydroxyacylglutathione hydrolase